MKNLLTAAALLFFSVLALSGSIFEAQAYGYKYGLGFTKNQTSAPLVTTTMNFTAGDALPAWLTYTRNDAVSTYRNSSYQLTLNTANTPAYEYAADLTPMGLKVENTAVNTCTNHNATPAATTNVAVTGDATVTLVADATPLANAKLANVVTGNVFQAAGGAGGGTVVITCDSGSATAVAASLYARDVTSTGASFGITPAPTATAISGSAYARYEARVTSTATTDDIVITIPAGVTINFILNQLETTDFATSVIKTAGASATRAAVKITDGSGGSSIENQVFYNERAGAIAAVVDFDNIDVQPQQSILNLTIGTGTTYGYGVYHYTSPQVRARGNYNSNNAFAGGFASVDKVGAEYPVAISWSPSTIEASGGAAVFDTVAPGGVITGMDRFDLAARPFSENMYGHIRKLYWYNKFQSLSQLADTLITAGGKGIITSGQSNMYGAFNQQNESLNGGERAAILQMDTYWPALRNYFISAATSATAVECNATFPVDCWLNPDTGELGYPFQRWVKTAQANVAAGLEIIAIMDDGGTSDAGVISKDDFKSTSLEKFEIMRGIVGNVPVYLIPMTRRDPGDAKDAKQSIWQGQKELTEEYDWIKMLPDRWYATNTDGVHLNNAGQAESMRQYVRFIADDLGETVSGPVEGPHIRAATRSGTTVTVELTLPSGITDFTPTTAIQGFRYFNGGSGTTELSITNAVRTDADTITLTLSGTPTGTEILYYMYGSGTDVSDVTKLVRGNDTYAMMLQRFAENVPFSETPIVSSYLLLESGDHILLESGDKILME